ncbi:MAG: hypothetical protein AAGM22_30555 [Acidobacteriota bacterium]
MDLAPIALFVLMSVAGGGAAGHGAETSEPTNADPLYVAAWREGAPETRFTPGVDPSDVRPPAGFRLEDVDVTRIQGQTHYAGVFRRGDAASSRLLQPHSPTAFEGIVHAQASEHGRCLLGFEAWSHGGEAFFAGVFADGCAGAIFRSQLGIVEFTELAHELSGSHHLVDLESLVIDGRPTFSAVWHSGTKGREWRLLSVGEDSFHDLTHDLTAEGYRLVDLDVQKDPLSHHHLAELEPASAARVRPAEGRDTRKLRHGDWLLSGMKFSAVWRRAGGADWLGYAYHGDQLGCAHALLTKGHAQSGIAKDGAVLCDPGWIAPAPTEAPKGLVFVESLAVSFPPDATHGGPLHDSGTAGDP